MSPQRLTRIVAKIKYQLNDEINKITKNTSINFQKIPDISIKYRQKNSLTEKAFSYKLCIFFILKKYKNKMYYLLFFVFFSPNIFSWGPHNVR